MKDYSAESFKNLGVFIVHVAGVFPLLFGLMLAMVHVFKVLPEKMWIYRKSLWARKFIDSEIEQLAKDKAYKIRGSAAALGFLFIGTIVTIVCIINLINYISVSVQNLPH
ncbi:hypothetical protein [Chitinophaga silvisoli]|uniref:Uncharacterized protein n=1 Tax=Chitinophaga silvisoli TaxID=2291814 RepID=A0A3E1NMP7_9BACT|nr:hypothetical protein [Chitinophaga silvisoli]RFM29183.1 hypothetical protein DXN04_33980 [Chitinophaga silvisoli]